MSDDPPPVPKTPATSDVALSAAPTDVQIVVVGAGPTGLYASLLLAHAGVRTVVLEARSDVRHHGGASHWSADTLCNLQRSGLAEFVADDAHVQGFRDRPKGMRRPHTMRAFYNGQKADPAVADEDMLAILPGLAEGAFGLPSLAYMYQGHLEENLLEQVLKHKDHVTVKFSTRVTALRQDANQVIVEAGGETFNAQYVIAADGVSSFVRKNLGVKWLERDGGNKYFAVVYDLKAKNAATLDKVQYWHGTYQEASVERPFMFIPLPQPYFRYTTWPKGGETADDMSTEAFVSKLLKDKVGIELGVDYEIDRASPYWIRHRVTDEYVRGRCIFVGDASHVMGPFVGQGVNHGIRGVGSLIWKVVLALKGRAPAALIQTQHSEMQPVAERLVAWTIQTMHTMHTRSPFFAAFRDNLIQYPMKKGMAQAGETFSWKAADVAALDLNANSYQLVTRAYRTEATGKLFAQPKVTIAANSEPTHLYALVRRFDFMIIGFNADPQAELGASQSGRLASFGITFLAINVHDATPALTVVEDGTVLATEAMTGDLFILPKWRANHAMPTFIVVRPDLYIYAGVQTGQLTCAIDELLADLADPPLPPAEPESTWLGAAASSIGLDMLWGALPDNTLCASSRVTKQAAADEKSSSVKWQNAGAGDD